MMQQDDYYNKAGQQRYSAQYDNTVYEQSDEEEVYYGGNQEEPEPPKKEKKKRRWLFWLFFLTALCVFIYSSFQLFTIFKANWDEKRESERITEIGNIPEDPETPFEVNWDELRAINADVVAWIIVPDTNISYPIVRGSDNDYYLNRTFEKAYNYAGSIFMDYKNKGDFSDNNTFLYGHNTRHSTMFGQLEEFTNQDFFTAHKYIYIFTPEQNYKAEIVSFHSAKDGSDFYKYGIQNPAEWKKYIESITASTIDGFVHKDVSVGDSDRIVSLSTCSYEINNELTDQRYLLHAKLVPWIGQYTQESPADE